MAYINDPTNQPLIKKKKKTLFTEALPPKPGQHPSTAEPCPPNCSAPILMLSPCLPPSPATPGGTEPGPIELTAPKGNPKPEGNPKTPPGHSATPMGTPRAAPPASEPLRRGRQKAPEPAATPSPAAGSGRTEPQRAPTPPQRPPQGRQRRHPVPRRLPPVPWWCGCAP